MGIMANDWAEKSERTYRIWVQRSAMHMFLCHTLMEKQILKIVWAVQETERIADQDSVTVHPPLTIHRWVTGNSFRAHTGIDQAATHWKHYLQQ